ncbi:LOW QUALITY PROTEIN: lysosomal-trafficking regulator-like [Rhinatrema bivittatum]|uniref:LOW QUALITY PROTEIN: lysosomal-trafficking regulator-like n=3 Tax=Rhinatrema bivittatum TaxID=194408 RepID=UPI001127CFFB|nr:LOW QUALITY PROTEIN: lysosomal-trafficking regulator-like [Rhinatrema bivittatum]
MSSASNSLAREFLTDVSKLCNAVFQRAEAKEDEEEEYHMAVLGQYLVHGRGFLLLNTLNCMVDQDLTCREELVTLLLSLLPLVWKIPIQEEKSVDFNLPFSVDALLTKEDNSSFWKPPQEKLHARGRSCLPFRVPSKLSSYWKTRHLCKTSHRYSVTDALKTQLSTSYSEGNFDDKTSAMVKHRRSHFLQLYQPQENYSANQSDPQTSEPNFTLDPMNLENAKNIMPGQEFSSGTLNKSAAVSIVNNKENSPFDLCCVLLSLLEKVCKFDIVLNHNSALVASVVPTLIEFLSRFGDYSNLSGASESKVVYAGWTEEPIALIQRMLLRTILHIISVDINSSTMPDNLRKNMIDLLRAALKIRACLEKQSVPLHPRQKTTLEEIQEDFTCSKYQRIFLLPELLEGVLQVLLCCFQSAASDPFYFSQIMDLVHEFIQHQGVELFETTVLQMEWLVTRNEEVSAHASEHVTVLIDSIMKITNTVKKVKSEQLHQSVCTRKRHTRCDYSHFMHHHRDLSGLPISTFQNQTSKNRYECIDEEVNYPERCCCIAVCCHQSLQLIQQVSLSSTCVQILSGIQNVGICCCMDPQSVITPLIKALKLPVLKHFQQNILNILSKLILDQLGGGGEVSGKIKQAACNICTIDCDQLAELKQTLHEICIDSDSTSNFCGTSFKFQGILPCGGSEDVLWKWDVLKAYQPLVFGEDHQLRIQITRHICDLIKRGNAVVQCKLYIYIFNPVLQRGVELAHHFQQLGISTECNYVCTYHAKCLHPGVLQICLQTLPTLLKSRIIRDLFLNCNGVNQLIELNNLETARYYSLKVFETLICSFEEQHNLLVSESEAGIGNEIESILDLTFPVYEQQTFSNASQSLSKFYACLKETCSKKNKATNQEVHVNIINIFLCMAFLCVSKETDSDRDSASDSEDTSDYDSTASESLSHGLPSMSLDSLALPSPEKIQRTGDVWSMCCWIYMSNSVFRKQFHILAGFEVCHKLIMMIIQQFARKKENVDVKSEVNASTHEIKDLTDSICNEPDSTESSSRLTVCRALGLLEKTNDSYESVVRSGPLNEQAFSTSCGQSMIVEQTSTKGTETEKIEMSLKLEDKWSQHSIRLFEALLSICLHAASTGQQKVEMELSYQRLSVEQILLEMREQLAQSRVVETELAKPLFDVLLNIALSNYSADFDHSEEKNEKLQQTKDDLVCQPEKFPEEVESQSFNFKQFPEDGYEADSESNLEDCETKEDADIQVDVGYRGPSNNLMENITPGELTYPEICTLELDLLSAGCSNLNLLSHVLHGFVRIIQHKEKNATLLNQQGAVKMILGRFRSILLQTDTAFQECQIVLIKLVISLMSSRTYSEDLAFLMRIFLEKMPPTGILLKGILKIVEINIDMSPLQYLTFPLHQTLSNIHSSQKSTNTASSIKYTGMLRRAQLSQSKKELYANGLLHCLLSSWHVAPIHLPLVGQNCWPHMSEGFSVSLWFNMNCNNEAGSPTAREKKRRKSVFRDSDVGDTEQEGPGHFNYGDTIVEDGCVHIISLGSKALVLQIWADLNTRTFIFRLCIDPNDEMKAGVLAQAKSHENTFLLGKWQHLALTYLQQPEAKNNIHGNLSLWISGQRKPDVSLDYILPVKTSLSSESNKAFCMIGHGTSTQEDLLRLAGKWHLGNLLLFNGGKIGPEEAFYLYVNGPDFISMMPCKYGKTGANYSKYINENILQCEQIKELLMKEKDVDIGPLIESLAVVYSTRSPAQYIIDEPVIKLKGQMKTEPAQRPFSSKDVQNNFLGSLCLKTLQPTKKQKSTGYLHEIGGIGTFIFLFARVVDISTCEETQAMTLQIILSLTKYNHQRIQEIENCGGYLMVNQVLIKPKCLVGFYILKALLEGCCGDQILKIESGQFKLDMDSTAVIQDIKLLEDVLLDWKIWSKAQHGVWETLLAALHGLIRANHHQQMFNIRQLLRARVVHNFLLTCQVLQEHREGHLTSVRWEVFRSFLKIIEEVLGSPPDLELLKLIFSFLLAVHPPTNTYVCHNPTNFFFSLHVDGKRFQEKLQHITMQRNSSCGGWSNASPEFLVTNPSGFTAGLHEDKTTSMLFPHSMLPLIQRPWSRSLPASPVSSPQMNSRKVGGSLKRSINDLPGATVADQQEYSFAGSSETFKKLQEELVISNCESAETVCISEELSALSSFVEIAKEELNLPVFYGDNKDADREHSFGDEDAGDESFLCRPDHLKGLSSFQRSHSNLTTLGLAFSAQSGSSTIARWPSTAEQNLVDEEWENFAFPPLYEQVDQRSAEDCIVLICCGLYDLLHGVLLILPDLMLADVMDNLIQPDVLLVLVNHPSPMIQQRVIKLLDAYFNRASKDQKEKFLKNHGFSLLGNQLFLHQGTQGLLECLLEMLFGRSVHLDEEFDLEDMKNISLFRKWCVISVLGLIENLLSDTTLLHNSFYLLLQILNSCSKLEDLLIDNGLLYVLCNTLATLNELETNISLNDYKLLVDDIQQLLVTVTIHACSSSGPQYFRVIEDLIILLGYLQKSKNKRTQNMAIVLQFRVLQSAIEYIKTTANQDSQNLTSSFHLPPLHHHPLYQKQKSIDGPRRFSCVQADKLLMRMRSVANDELTMMMQRRMSQENPVRATETEFVQRMQRLTILAVNRLIYQDLNQDYLDVLCVPETTIQNRFSVFQSETSEGEIPQDLPNIMKTFKKEIFKIMVEGIKTVLSTGRSSTSGQQWKTILWSCRDTFRVQLGRFLVHILSPGQPLQDKKQALEIVHEPKYQEIMRECLNPALQNGPKLALYLNEFMHYHKDELTKDELTAAELFMNVLKLSGYRCIPSNVPPNPDLLSAIKEEKNKYETDENINKAAWEKTISSNQQNLFQRLDTKLRDISKIAGDITQAVSFSQGMERKKVIQHIRGMYKVDLSASRHWQELIQQLTHDGTVWYDSDCYPTSWQLDPTEGPNRERRRLQRSYLTIPNKYILRDQQKQEVIKSPLCYLFEDKTHSSSSTVKDKAASELIRLNRRCISVAPARETAGELLLGKSGMYFVEDNAANTVESSTFQGETEPASFSWTYEEIKEVHTRWWQLRDNAVEIFLTNGRTLLLAFDNIKVRDDVFHSILTNNLPNLLEYGNITALTHLWYTGQMTNFEYLTHLNKHAGRSFNDLMQYPVFPFILADYTSETLDLNDASIYRNLAKPIAVQTKEKEDRYVDNYKYLEEEYRKGARDDDPMPPVQPYHYGSHYSNSGTVLHFLVRMPPFTKMFLAYQDQSFDIPDRTFHSMNTTWRLSSYESMTDVKELVPEFFYLPEFLVNREGFDFGVRQNGGRVNHVNLPLWARNDSRLFILIHRQALESDYVSQTICQWIDLVFGYKQKGRSAVQAINVFHPATYFGMDVSAVEDPVQRRALETMIKTYGQTPRQLFQTAHVSRPGSKLIMEGELPAAMGLLVQLAFREARDHTKDIIYPSPLPWIRGLKWGEYVGSPSAPDPVVCFSQLYGESFGLLQALPTRAICGLSQKFCLMMVYSKEQGVRSMHSTDIQWSAILSWGYADNILRLKSKQSEPPINFIQSSQLHQVTSSAWVPESCQLFTGSKCGVITAYLNSFTSITPSEIEVESEVHLYGHTAEITSLFVCKPYSIIISVSKDGSCIIWDLNRLCYVQSLNGHKSPVTAVSASETTGDIATVCDSVGGGSDLRLWTVNGDLVGHVHCREIICSVAFSNQPEGISVNVIAGGLENGIVRLWSTWDLKPVREIVFPKSNKPIVSLTFSCDGHHLYTANSDGTVIAWCRKDQQRLKLPMFYSFLSSYAAG